MTLLASAVLVSMTLGQLEVPLDFKGCDESVPREQISDLLALELRDVAPDVARYVQRSQPRATLRCERAEIELVVTTRDGLAYREQVKPSGRGLARFLAIAIVESLSAHSNGVVVMPPVERTPPPTSPRRLRVLAGASLQSRAAWASGVLSVGVDVPLFAPSLKLTFGASGSYGAVTVSQGVIHAGTVTGAIALRLGGTWSRLSLSAALGLRGGAIYWLGVAKEGAGVLGRGAVGALLGPLLSGTFGFDATERLRFELDVEGDWLPLASQAAAADTVIASSGPLRGAILLGVSWSF